MKIAFFTKHLGRSWQVAALYKEAISRGHQVDVFADCQKLSATYPLECESIPWRVDPVYFEEEEKYDLVVPFSEPLNSSWLKKTGFSLGIYPGGAGSYKNLASSTLSPLLHNVWISQHEFEEKERVKQGFDYPHPVIGMPSISLYKAVEKQPKREGILGGLYLNGPPFFEALKKKFDAFLYRIAEKEKGVEIHIKERFSQEDEGLHFLWNPIEEKKQPRVLIHPAQASAVELIKKCDFIMGVNSTAFLEALYLDKPVVSFSDFGNERFVGELTKDTYWYAAPGYTFCTNEELEKDFISCIKRTRSLSSGLKNKLFPFADPALHILNVAEEIHAILGQIPKEGLFIPISYTSRENYRETLLSWKKKAVKEKDILLRDVKEKRDALAVRREILMRMAAVFPYLLDEETQKFCSDYERLLKQHKVEKVLENLPLVLYSWLVKNGHLSEETLVREGDLIEGSTRFFFVEALFTLKMIDSAAFAFFEERTKLVIPKALEVYRNEYSEK